MKRFPIYGIGPVFQSKLLSRLQHVLDPALIRIWTNKVNPISPMNFPPMGLDQTFELIECETRRRLESGMEVPPLVVAFLECSTATNVRLHQSDCSLAGLWSL